MSIDGGDAPPPPPPPPPPRDYSVTDQPVVEEGQAAPDRLDGQESPDKPDQTRHGADRTADPSRLDAAAQADVTAHPTQEYTQSDGANVYEQQVGDRYNIVVQGDGGVVTNFKTIDENARDRLAKNYGWTPK